MVTHIGDLGWCCLHPDGPESGQLGRDLADGYPAACPLRDGPLLVRLPVPDPGGE